VAPLPRRTTPEERELERKQRHLAKLQTDLVQRELDLATLHAELRTFERRYLRIVGTKYAELDALLARIAELEAQRAPQDARLQEAAKSAEADARESAAALRGETDSAPPEPFVPGDDLKKLFREAVKKMHPDLGLDPEDRARRERFMKAVNRAWADKDATRIQELLREWDESPEAVAGEGTAAELVKVIRRIAQVERRLQAIDAEMTTLKGSDLYKLREKAIEAEAAGRDLLAEMAHHVSARIATAQTRVAELSRAG
jgi:hypothetical protein